MHKLNIFTLLVAAGLYNAQGQDASIESMVREAVEQSVIKVRGFMKKREELAKSCSKCARFLPR